MGSIFVINTNADDHVDRYNGEEYIFPGKKDEKDPGTPVLVPKEAATHMFGWNLPDKTDTLVRLGWATRYDPKQKCFVEDSSGIKRLAGFVFDEVATVQKSVLERARPKALV